MSQTSSHWTNVYFSAIYNKVYSGPLYSEQNTDLEIEFLQKHLEQKDKHPLCDLGCAFGRHLRPLKKKGVKVVGLDRFFHLLDDHPKRGRRLVNGDMRQLPFTNASISGMYCLFNSFGYYGHEENDEIIAEWSRVLIPGGRIVLQIPNRPVMAEITREFAPSQMLTENFMMTEVYEYDDKNNRMLGKGIWQFNEDQHPWEFELYLYSYEDMKEKFNRNGLTIIECFEDYDENDFDVDDSAEMIFVVEKDS